MYLLSPRVGRLHRFLPLGAARDGALPEAVRLTDTGPAPEPDLGPRVRAALARLPEVDRHVLSAVSGGRVSYSDVAVLAGVDARGARTALHRAVMALQRELSLASVAPSA